MRLYLKSVGTITCKVLKVSQSDLQKVYVEESEQSVVWPNSPRHTEVISKDVSDHELDAFQVIGRDLLLARTDLNF